MRKEKVRCYYGKLRGRVKRSSREGDGGGPEGEREWKEEEE